MSNRRKGRAEGSIPNATSTNVPPRGARQPRQWANVPLSRAVHRRMPVRGADASSERRATRGGLGRAAARGRSARAGGPAQTPVDGLRGRRALLGDRRSPRRVALRAARGLLAARSGGYARGGWAAGSAPRGRGSVRAVVARARRCTARGCWTPATGSAAASSTYAASPRCNAAAGTWTPATQHVLVAPATPSWPAGCCSAHAPDRRPALRRCPIHSAGCRPASSYTGSSSASARSPRSTASTSTCPRGSASACSVPTAPASPPRCGCSPARRSRTRASCACSATSCPDEAKEARAEMGVVPQLDNLDVDVTVEDNLAVFARLYRVTDVRAAVDRALDARAPRAAAATTRSTSSRAGCAAACCSRAGSCTGRGCCCSTSRPSASTRRSGPSCGR